MPRQKSELYMRLSAILPSYVSKPKTLKELKNILPPSKIAKAEKKVVEKRKRLSLYERMEHKWFHYEKPSSLFNLLTKCDECGILCHDKYHERFWERHSRNSENYPLPISKPPRDNYEFRGSYDRERMCADCHKNLATFTRVEPCESCGRLAKDLKRVYYPEETLCVTDIKSNIAQPSLFVKKSDRYTFYGNHCKPCRDYFRRVSKKISEVDECNQLITQLRRQIRETSKCNQDNRATA